MARAAGADSHLEAGQRRHSAKWDLSVCEGKRCQRAGGQETTRFFLLFVYKVHLMSHPGSALRGSSLAVLCSAGLGKELGSFACKARGLLLLNA